MTSVLEALQQEFGVDAAKTQAEKSAATQEPAKKAAKTKKASKKAKKTNAKGKKLEEQDAQAQQDQNHTSVANVNDDDDDKSVKIDEKNKQDFSKDQDNDPKFKKKKKSADDGDDDEFEEDESCHKKSVDDDDDEFEEDESCHKKSADCDDDEDESKAKSETVVDPNQQDFSKDQDNEAKFKKSKDVEPATKTVITEQNTQDVSKDDGNKPLLKDNNDLDTNKVSQHESSSNEANGANTGHGAKLISIDNLTNTELIGLVTQVLKSVDYTDFHYEKKDNGTYSVSYALKAIAPEDNTQKSAKEPVKAKAKVTTDDKQATQKSAKEPKDDVQKAQKSATVTEDPKDASIKEMKSIISGLTDTIERMQAANFYSGKSGKSEPTNAVATKSAKAESDDEEEPVGKSVQYAEENAEGSDTDDQKVAKSADANNSMVYKPGLPGVYEIGTPGKSSNNEPTLKSALAQQAEDQPAKTEQVSLSAAGTKLKNLAADAQYYASETTVQGRNLKKSLNKVFHVAEYAEAYGDVVQGQKRQATGKSLLEAYDMYNKLTNNSYFQARK